MVLNVHFGSNCYKQFQTFAMTFVCGPVEGWGYEFHTELTSVNKFQPMDAATTRSNYHKTAKEVLTSLGTGC